LGLVFVVGCVTGGGKRAEVAEPTADGKIVEEAILWRAERGPEWEPVKLEKLVKDQERFVQEGNFYRVKEEDDLIVFGHPATYVGLLGIDLYAGPNVLLKGRPKSIAAVIEAREGVKFKRGEDGLVCEYADEILLIVGRHPNVRGESILIGAYIGP